MTTKDVALTPDPEDRPLTTKDAVVAMLPRLAEAAPVLAETLAGGAVSEFQLDSVHVPGAGSTTWVIPGLEGEDETKVLEGVLVGYKYTRAYWAKAYSAANPAPPDCTSNDAITGTGDRGQYGSGPQDCGTCPLAEWGSKGEDRRSQACKTMIPMFILRPGSFLPLKLVVPPSSLRSVQSYLLRIVGQGVPWWGCVTSFTLERKEVGGYPTAVIKVVLSGRLDAEQAAQMKAYVELLRPLVKRTGVGVDDAIDVDAP